MIATMLQHAEGSFDERVAAVLPTLKVILLGGMQEPGHAAGSTVAGLLESGQAAASRPTRHGLVRDAIEEGLRWVSPIGTQTRRVLVETELGGVRLPAGANLGALVSSANRDEEVFGPTADALRPLPPGRTTPRSGSALTSAPAITSRGSRCGSRCSGSSSGSRTCAPTRPATGVQTAGSFGRRSTFMSAGTRDLTLHA